METGTKVVIGAVAAGSIAGIVWYLLQQPTDKPSVGIALTWDNISQQYPTFEVGTTHVANIHLTNPTQWPWSYWGQIGCYVWSGMFWKSLYQGPDYPPDDIWQPGATHSLQATVPINTAGTHNVYLVIKDSETNTELFSDVIDVITAIEPAVPAVGVTLTWN